MNEQEFVAKAYSDKAYMTEVLCAIPDDIWAELEAKGKQQQNQQNTDNLGETMCEYFVPAAKEMGLSFDEAVLAAECESQIRALGGFAKLKFLGRFISAASKATKQRKKK